MPRAMLSLSALGFALLTACSTPTAPPKPVVAPPSAASPNATALAAAPVVPEGPSGFTGKVGVQTGRLAVASANPLATAAGLKMLQAGGSAIDAAIAVQMVLTLVEPQSSGIGGGLFLLHHSGKTGKTVAIDGRETAPAGAREDMFLQSGKPMPFADAAASGLSVGVPGAVAALALAHAEHGLLPWAQLFQPAIALSEAGFQVSHRLHTQLATETALKRDPVAAEYFYNAQGNPWPIGHTLKNPELADVLRRIATGGARAFSAGPVAQAVADKVQKHPQRPGSLTTADMASYQAVAREPLCFDQKWTGNVPAAIKGSGDSGLGSDANTTKMYRLCGMPPPSSGAIAVAQILNLQHRAWLNTRTSSKLGGVAPHDVAGLHNPAANVDFLHTYAEASKLAFADRAQYVADPAFVPAPAKHWQSLLGESYLAQRAQLIGPMAMKTAPAGVPSGTQTAFAPQGEQAEYGTSHVSIADAFGNVLAMTTTIEAVFGSRLMVNASALAPNGQPSRAGGFLLNNQLTDFSMLPTASNGQPIANRVQPGKRPRSSMSPTLVFEPASGQVLMTVGSPGGAVIIHFTAKTLLGTLLWGLTPQAAIDLPNFGTLGGPTLLEEGRFSAETVNALKAKGHEVREMPLTSGLQALQRNARGWLGGADPRREGAVLGDAPVAAK